MWDLPRWGIEPMSPALADGFFTTEPPGKASPVQSLSCVRLFVTPWTAAHCPSPTPGASSNSCPSSRWCHPAISSSVVPFSSRSQELTSNSTESSQNKQKQWVLRFHVNRLSKLSSLPMIIFLGMRETDWQLSQVVKLLQHLPGNWSELGWRCWRKLLSKTEHLEKYCLWLSDVFWMNHLIWADIVWAFQKWIATVGNNLS